MAQKPASSLTQASAGFTIEFINLFVLVPGRVPPVLLPNVGARMHLAAGSYEPVVTHLRGEPLGL